jgi:hypothetical protein
MAGRLRLCASHNPTRTQILAEGYKSQRRAHLPVRAAPGELGGERPQIDPVFIAEGIGTDAVLLLVMMHTAETDPKDVVRPLGLAAVGGRAQMGKINAQGTAARNAAAMRLDPAAVPLPDLL